MTSSWRLNVLNPGGRDPTQDFSSGSATDSGAHAPVNFHAYAACTGGKFLREVEQAIAERASVLLLLRGNFRASERALAALQNAGVKVAVSLKETGLHQIAQQLVKRDQLERFLRIVRAADGCLAPTPEAADLYRAIRGQDSLVTFLPTPYPLHEPSWDFSQPIEQRHGIFIGTREWDVPSRNHAAALLAARKISAATGEPVTVYDFDKTRGTRRLRAFGFAEHQLRILQTRTGYADYLRTMAAHKIVFQLDTSFVPGQVAGDALLARLPCVGGNGAIERVAFPNLCGAQRSIGELIEEALALLKDGSRYLDAITAARARATDFLSFAKVAQTLQEFFASIE